MLFRKLLFPTLNKNIQCFAVYSKNFCVKPEHDNEKEVFFGHQKVSPIEKRLKVQSVFSNVAEKYDLMNDVMSIGIHRVWKDYFMHLLSPIPGMQLIDVAGGTGDIALRFLNASGNKINDFSGSHVTVLDLNDKMLSVCKRRAEQNGYSESLNCIQGNAEILPFTECSFDAYTIAFGIRNVVHIDEALLEAFRVLKPGGRFLCLEFSKVTNSLFERIYSAYSHEIIPVIGEIVAGDWKSYQYLVESIEKFPNQENFSSMVKIAGFSDVSFINLSNGIAAIHSGYKL